MKRCAHCGQRCWVRPTVFTFSVCEEPVRQVAVHSRCIAAYLMTPEGRIWLDTVLEMLAAGKTFRRVT